MKIMLDTNVLISAFVFGGQTGDKDFLESDIEQPLIFSPGMMIEYLNSRSLDRINA